MQILEILLYSVIVITLFGFALYHVFLEVKKTDKSSYQFKNYQPDFSIISKKEVKEDLNHLIGYVLKRKKKSTSNKNIKKVVYETLCDMESDGVYFPKNKSIKGKYVSEEYLNKIKTKLQKNKL